MRMTYEERKESNGNQRGLRAIRSTRRESVTGPRSTSCVHNLGESYHPLSPELPTIALNSAAAVFSHGSYASSCLHPSLARSKTGISARRDRKSVVYGKSVQLGGRRIV